MALFFNQRKPKAFNYIPRTYDPAKEAREERKKEVLGERYKAPGGERPEDYVPGNYLREHVNSRRNNTENDMFRRRKRKRHNMTILAAILVLLMLIVWIMYFR